MGNTGKMLLSNLFKLRIPTLHFALNWTEMKVHLQIISVALSLCFFWKKKWSNRACTVGNILGQQYKSESYDEVVREFMQELQLQN